MTSEGGEDGFESFGRLDQRLRGGGKDPGGGEGERGMCGLFGRLILVRAEERTLGELTLALYPLARSSTTSSPCFPHLIALLSARSTSSTSSAEPFF